MIMLIFVWQSTGIASWGLNEQHLASLFIRAIVA